MAENVEISSGNSDDTDKKNEIATTSEDEARHVVLKFVDQKDGAVCMKVKRNKKFGLAFETYRKKQKLDAVPNFVYNGSRISASITPADLNFGSREQIDVYTITYGG